MSSPAASDDAFTHEPLPDPVKYMRLLEVLDDNHSKTTKVRCRLTTWPLDSMPPYHAISYTWGDPKSNTAILMNDKTLKVRTNCEFALKQAYWYRRSQSYFYRKRRSRLYRENRPEWYTESRYLWLDALCIDQTNDHEKSKQVAMMGSIYKKASHVLSCIGDHADDSLFFFQTLYGPTHLVVPTRSMFTRSDPERGNEGLSTKFRLLHRYSTTHRFVLALARLALRPYFTRMWILQELQHAQNITILCGQYVLSKDDAIYLFNGVSEGLKRYSSSEDGYFLPITIDEHLIQRKFYRRSVNYGMPHPVLHGDWIRTLPKQCTATVVMLEQSHRKVKHNIFQLLKDVVYRLECIDPRDKVYGLISLIDWGELAPLEPDYTQTDLEVAVNFIKAIIKFYEVQELDEPIWKYVAMTVKLFNFNIDSRGFSGVLESRLGVPEDEAVPVETTSSRGPTLRFEQAAAWRLAPEDISKNNAKLQGLQATPVWTPVGDSFYLPRWAAANDWVIEVDRQGVGEIWYDSISDRHHLSVPTYKPLLVMREGATGRANALIGYGFYSELRGFDRPSFKYDTRVDVSVDLDVEDAIVFFWRMKQLNEVKLGNTTWILEYLEMGVCKKQTPWSSLVTLPPEVPARRARDEPTSEDRDWKKRMFWKDQLGQVLFRQERCWYVLFDTKDRRGWLVNGHVVMLQLLCAYLRNIPQKEPFDFSRLKHFDPEDPMAAPRRVLANWKNMNITIFRVLENVEETPAQGESPNGLGNIEKRLLNDVLADIHDVMNTIRSNQEYPGDPARFTPRSKRLKRRKNVMVKGWDFERMYRHNKHGKVHTHCFDRDPGWLDLAKDLGAKLIFGSGFGDIMKRRDGCCCPYFKSVPLGQDYLAVDDIPFIREAAIKFLGPYDSDEVVARFSYSLAWERGINPFSHSHGHGDHLEEVDSSCFPVQRVVRAPPIYDHKNMDKRHLKRGRLYSIQDIEDMLVAGDTDTTADNERTQGGKRPVRLGLLVFGNKPDDKKLRQLAAANLRDVHPLSNPRM